MPYHQMCLVVDDDLRVRMFLRAVLESEQFEVLEAGGGRGALETILALDGGIQLLISDIQMPDGDGLTLATAVRERFPQIPILLISGLPSPDPAFRFLQKPFTWARLASEVRTAARSKAA